MAPTDKPSRLGRGLDALLARRETPRLPDPAAPNSAPVLAANIPSVVTPERISVSIGSPANSTSSSPYADRLPDTEIRLVAALSSVNIPVAPLDNQTDSSATAPSLAKPVASGRVNVASDREKVDTRTLGYRSLPIGHIAPNPFQPRKEFHPQDLADLEASLRSQGLLQPITVRPSPNHSGYELIAGERRLRAATRLGWTEIPAIVRETNDRTMHVFKIPILNTTKFIHLPIVTRPSGRIIRILFRIVKMSVT